MPADRIRAFFQEASRRKVVRTALMYGGVSLALATGAEYIFPALLFPEWAFRLFVVLLILGFPIALIFAWVFDITPAGVVRAEAGADAPSAADATATAGAATTAAATTEDARSTAPPVRHAPRPEPAARDAPPKAEPLPEAVPPDPERVRKASLANLRQELLTPIDAIAGYADMLLDDARSAGLEEAAGILEKMSRAGADLRGMANSFLDPEGMLANGSDDPEAISAHIRHELRNPVNALIGYGELLKEEGCVEGDLTRLEGDIDRLLESAHHVNGLIRRIAAFPVSDPVGEGQAAELAASAEVARDVLAKIRPRTAAARSMQQGTLLVVDDNATNRDLLSRRLARQGFTVVAAESGERALEIAGERKIDLVLLDVLMPGMDGVEVLRRLKAEGATAAIPVIMLSALDEIDSALGCVDMGAEDFLPKSFEPVLLRVRINACLELRRLRDREREYERSLDQERALTEHLLGSLCPAPFAARVLNGESDIVEEVSAAAVVVGRLEGTRRTVSGIERPRDAVERLRALLGRIEALAPAHGVHLLRVDGDGFTAAAGLDGDGGHGAAAAAAFALAAVDETRRFGKDNGVAMDLRVGGDVGRLMAGLLQTGRLAFDAWGEALHTAAAIASGAGAGSVQVSARLFEALRDSFALAPIGEREMRDVGRMRLYELTGRNRT